MSSKDDERSGKTEGRGVSWGVSVSHSKGSSISSTGGTETTSISHGESWGITGDDRESSYTTYREEFLPEDQRRVLLREVHRLTGEGERAAIVEGLTSKGGTVTFFIRIPLEELSGEARAALQALFPEK